MALTKNKLVYIIIRNIIIMGLSYRRKLEDLMVHGNSIMPKLSSTKSSEVSINFESLYLDNHDSHMFSTF